MLSRPRNLLLSAAVALSVVSVPLLVPRAAATDRVIVVRAGQTLGEIAIQHGTSIDRLVELNHLADPNRIYAGQRLRVSTAKPAPAKPAAAKPVAVTHRVAYGETLSGIAARYRVSLASIAAANGITNVSFIRTGQVLTIPGAAAGAARPTSGGAPNGRMPSAMAAVVARRQGVARLIVAEARAQGVPVAFALAVAWQESGWQTGVVSSAGAIGVMQLLPSTGEWVGSAMLGQRVNLWDPASNVRAGVRLLRHYLDRYGGSRSLALAAYYQGQTAADRYGVFAVTRPYIASITQLERIFGG